MIERPSDEAVERMVALVRKMARDAGTTPLLTTNYVEARFIAALLPKPVDPAVLACRGAWREVFGTQPAEDSPSFRAMLSAYHAGQSHPIGDQG